MVQETLPETHGTLAHNRPTYSSENTMMSKTSKGARWVLSGEGQGQDNMASMAVVRGELRASL